MGRRQGWLLVPRARVSGHVRGAFRTAATQARLCHRHAEQLAPRRVSGGASRWVASEAAAGRERGADLPCAAFLGRRRGQSRLAVSSRPRNQCRVAPCCWERRRNWMPWLQLSSWLVHSSIPQIFTKCSPCVRHCDNLVRFKHERVLCFKELVPLSSGWINPEVFVFVLISPRTCRAKSYQRPSVYFPI